MLHAPSVVRLGERRFHLVTGFLRIEVMRRLGDEFGWFRVVEGDEEDRLLWNLGENTARRDLTGYRTRGESEWFGGADVHHVFFEGIRPEGEDVWRIGWGS